MGCGVGTKVMKHVFRRGATFVQGKEDILYTYTYIFAPLYQTCGMYLCALSCNAYFLLLLSYLIAKESRIQMPLAQYTYTQQAQTLWKLSESRNIFMLFYVEFKLQQ